MYYNSFTDNVAGFGPLFKPLPEISWELTYFCNYHCSYCWQKHDTKVKYRYPILSKVIQDLQQIRDRFELVLFGGEPTTHPDFIDLLSLATVSLIADITVMTNNSQSLDWYKRMADRINQPSSIKFQMAYHYEKSNLSRFVENVEFLLASGFLTHIILLCHRDNFDGVKQVYDCLSQVNANEFDIIKVDDAKGVMVPYSEAYLQWIDDVTSRHMHYDNLSLNYYIDRTFASQIIRSKYTYDQIYKFHESIRSLKGLKCKHDSFYIRQDGSFKTVCGLYENRNNIYFYQNFYSFYLAHLNETKICQYDTCVCDIHPESTKWR